MTASSPPLRDASRLLAPGVALMNRLRYPGKFALISVLFVLPLGLVMALLFDEINDRIDFAGKELRGARYLVAVRTLLERVARGRLAAQDADAATLQRMWQGMDRGLDDLAAVDGEVGDLLVTRDLFARLRNDIGALGTQLADGNRSGLDARYERVLADIQALIAQVRDTSNLILDPDLDTYYLMDACLIKLPEGVLLALDTALHGKKAIVPGNTLGNADRERFIQLQALLKANFEATRNALATAVRNAPRDTVAPALEGPLASYVDATQRLLQALERDVLHAPISLDAALDFRRCALAHLASNLQLWDSTAGELDKLLQRRRAVFARKEGFIAVLALVSLLLVSYLLLAFYASVSRTVRVLDEVARRMVGGEMEATPALASRDELAQVVASFNKIATRLRSEWAQARDESARARAAEEALVRARDEAERANRAKSVFLANMSHEIRTPMNGILGMTELALNTRLSAEQRDYLLLVKSSADALLTLINDVLDFSKIEAGKLELAPTEFNLRDALAETLKALALRGHQSGLEIIYHVAADVPDTIRADLRRLRQVIVNLVGNAIKFTEKGEVVLSIETMKDNSSRLDPRQSALMVQPSSLTLLFHVRDTGIGIAPEKQQSIFQPFEQADSSRSRRYTGTGLGLTISARLVEMMGGRIWLDSEPGRGSSFHFTICCERAEAAGSTAAPSPAPLHGRTVLVVDDNATNRRILDELLRGWGMEVTLAAGGQAALTELRTAATLGRPFALMLVDGHMPGLDGIALACRVKSEVARPPVMVLLTSDPSIGVEEWGRAGMAAALTKPISPSHLLQTILDSLQLAHLPVAAAVCPRRPPPSAARPLRVLVADDNAVNQKLATALLQAQGHDVLHAGNGREALEMLARQSVDLVLMDVQMPEVDGFAATAALRAGEQGTGRHVPIIALTAHALKGDRERCLQAGMDGYLAKPLRSEELYAALAAFAPPAAPRLMAEPVFDRAAALVQMGGSERILREIAQVFLADSSRLLQEVHAAVARRDAASLRRAAHSVKGSVSNFAAAAAVAAARRLEVMGEQNDFANVDEACQSLSREIRMLEQALAEFAQRV